MFLIGARNGVQKLPFDAFDVSSENDGDVSPENDGISQRGLNDGFGGFARRDRTHEAVKFSEEKVVYAIRQVDAGSPVGDMCRQLGVSEAAFYA